MHVMVVKLCCDFQKRSADVIYKRLRDEDDKPYDFIKWPQHRKGMLPEDIKIEESTFKGEKTFAKEEQTLDQVLEMWVKEGSVKGYGRKKIYKKEGGNG